jgi:hypothetical protein
MSSSLKPGASTDFGRDILEVTVPKKMPIEWPNPTAFMIISTLHASPLVRLTNFDDAGERSDF